MVSNGMITHRRRLKGVVQHGLGRTHLCRHKRRCPDARGRYRHTHAGPGDRRPFGYDDHRRVRRDCTSEPSAHGQHSMSCFLALRCWVLAPSAHISAHLTTARTTGCRATRTSPAALGFTSVLIPSPLRTAEYPLRVSARRRATDTPPPIPCGPGGCDMGHRREDGVVGASSTYYRT